MRMTKRSMCREVRARRRKDAEIRAEDRAKRTPAQQLARLDAAGHAAVRERARLGA